MTAAAENPDVPVGTLVETVTSTIEGPTANSGSYAETSGLERTKEKTPQAAKKTHIKERHSSTHPSSANGSSHGSTARPRDNVKRVPRKDRIQKAASSEQEDSEQGESAVPESDSADLEAKKSPTQQQRLPDDLSLPDPVAEEQYRSFTAVIRSNSQAENPQDPPTLDASESAMRFHLNEDDVQTSDDGVDPFMIYDEGGTERLEAKIAHFVALRTAGSPFFQANPPASLPVFAIEGKLALDTYLYSVVHL
jgi:hypothetical protein